MNDLTDLAGLWAGNIYGTNTGRIFLKLEILAEGQSKRVGTLKVSDDQFGLSSYSAECEYDGQTLTLKGNPTDEIEGVTQGAIVATGVASDRGFFTGEWNSTIGTGGAFVLHPHGGNEPVETAAGPEQIYTSQKDLGSLRLYKPDITEIISALRRKFPGSRIVVTHIDRGAELTQYAEEFEARSATIERLDWIKLTAQTMDDKDFRRSITIDLGQSFNRVTTQLRNFGHQFSRG